jgi:hypothetical protein
MPYDESPSLPNGHAIRSPLKLIAITESLPPSRDQALFLIPISMHHIICPRPDPPNDPTYSHPNPLRLQLPLQIHKSASSRQLPQPQDLSSAKWHEDWRRKLRKSSMHIIVQKILALHRYPLGPQIHLSQGNRETHLLGATRCLEAGFICRT